MAAHFEITPARSILVVSAYQAAVVMSLLPAAALAERFGYRRLFTCGLALFVMSSLVSAMASSFPVLVAARFAQGVGSAAVLALGIALIRFAVAESRLGEAISWNALTVALAAAAAPAFGGMLMSAASWHWIYLATLPAAATALACARSLPASHSQPGRIDLPGLGLNAAAFGCLIAGAASIRSASLLWPALLTAGAAALAVLILRDRSSARPLLPVDLLAGQPFRVSVMASAACFTGQSIALIALPFHLQSGFGLPAPVAASLLTIWPLSVALMTTAARRWISAAPTRLACSVGGSLLSAGLLGLWVSPFSGGPLPLVLSIGLCGAGFGVFQVANNRSMFLSAPLSRSGAAGALQGLARVTGQTGGAILAGLLFAALTAPVAHRTSFAIGAVFTGAAALLSYFGQPAVRRLPDERA
jgi:DHA2 family multidrug resistance protein-like MFS transporter